MKEKEFLLSSEEIRQLIKPMGSCYASDKITVDGMKVKYMYREQPVFSGDSGWRFFSGTETQEYVDDENNLMIYDLNTIVNYDPAIIPFLEMDTGTELERSSGDNFIIIN